MCRAIRARGAASAAPRPAADNRLSCCGTDPEKCPPRRRYRRARPVCMPTTSSSTSSGWRTMRGRARCGTKRCAICALPAQAVPARLGSERTIIGYQVHQTVMGAKVAVRIQRSVDPAALDTWASLAWLAVATSTRPAGKTCFSRSSISSSLVVCRFCSSRTALEATEAGSEWNPSWTRAACSISRYLQKE